MSIRSLLSKLYNPFIPLWFDRSIFDYIPINGKVLNVGSGSTKLRDDVVNLDVMNLPNVNIVADAHYLPFKANSFDCVFCSAVLEHTIKPWIVASEIQRVLKVKGVACIQVPFLEAVHDEYDYFRFTLKGLKLLFTELNEVKSGVSGSASQVLADLLRVFPTLVFENTFIDLPVKFIMSWIAIPFQWLDCLIKGKPSMAKYARAFYFIGQKS